MSGGRQFVKHAMYLSTLVLIRGLWVGKELTLDHRLQPCAYAQRGERRRRNLRRRRCRRRPLSLPRLISSEPFQKHAQESSWQRCNDAHMRIRAATCSIYTMQLHSETIDVECWLIRMRELTRQSTEVEPCRDLQAIIFSETCNNQHLWRDVIYYVGEW